MDKLTRIKDISVICSSIAVPIIVAVGAWYIQYSIAKDSNKKDYVQVAANILLNEKNSDPELRKWAITVFDTYSPIPLNNKLKSNLENGSVGIVCGVPDLPESFLTYQSQIHELQYIRKSDGLPELDMNKINNMTQKEIDKLYKPIMMSDLIENDIANIYEIKICNIHLNAWREIYTGMQEVSESISMEMAKDQKKSLFW